MRTLRILVLGLILLFSTANFALADSDFSYKVKEVDGYKVSLAFAGEKAQMGHNKLNILINDPKGNTVANAKVTVITELYQAMESNSSHGGSGMDMGNTGSGTTAPKLLRTMNFDMMTGPNPGMYEGEIDLDEAGHWMIKINSLINQQVKTVEFDEEVSQSGPNLIVIGAFIGVIVVIVAVALIVKRKSAKAPIAQAIK